MPQADATAIRSPRPIARRTVTQVALPMKMVAFAAPAASRAPAWA